MVWTPQSHLNSSLNVMTGLLENVLNRVLFRLSNCGCLDTTCCLVVMWKMFLLLQEGLLSLSVVYACLLVSVSSYSYLLRYIPEPAFCKGDSWYSLGWYRTSLLANEDEETSSISSLNEWLPISPARMSPFKRKLCEGIAFPTILYDTV